MPDKSPYWIIIHVVLVFEKKAIRSIGSGGHRIIKPEYPQMDEKIKPFGKNK